MLTVTIPVELFDEAKEEFILSKQFELRLEHSLVSVSKWESKWNKPFLTKDKKTDEQAIDYVRCMTITQNVDPIVYKHIPARVMNEISEYIEASMTATTFPKDESKTSKQIITSELIYYWMISFNIPFECQTWHLNRLLTLIRVCSVMNQPKKANPKTAAQQRKALNEARRKQFNTSG